MPEKQSETLNELKKLYRTRFPGQHDIMPARRHPEA